MPHTLTQFRQVFCNSDNNNQLLEPEESRKYRRNLLLLASIVILAGLMEGGPEDINFFGLQPSDKADVRWFCLFVFLAQVYWYLKRCLSIMDDGARHDYQYTTGNTQLLNALRSRHLTSLPRRSDLVSNILVLILTVLSWYFLWSWSD